MSMDMDRRQFLASSMGAAAMLLLGAEELRAAPPPPSNPAAPKAPPGPPVGCAVIGLGQQGRGLLIALARAADAPVVMVCDTYEPSHKRALETAPKATATTDYKKVLDNPAVQAVFLATPTHLHRQIALDAVAAGKHVYLEAPIAHTMDDAKAIALAGKGSAKLFQVGLAQRTDPQTLHVQNFVDTGALGRTAQIRAQWHKRQSWRRAAASSEREKALNWRLDKSVSTGLLGEIGIHQIDAVSWFLKALPVSVTGFGAITAWADGRDVPDTVQCLFEYPKNIHFAYDNTLANSFDSSYELFMGTDAAILLRDGRAWMFKEADSKALGWEVYARKEKIGDEEGIALVADATKQLALGKKPGETKVEATTEQDSIYTAVETFLTHLRDGSKPEAGALEGYQATVVALKAHEAIMSGSKVIYQPDWFKLA